jgi:hypothetical protein
MAVLLAFHDNGWACGVAEHQQAILANRTTFDEHLEA